MIMIITIMMMIIPLPACDFVARPGGQLTPQTRDVRLAQSVLTTESEEDSGGGGGREETATQLMN